MLAVMGVTGQVGGAIARQLLSTSQKVRAIVRDADKGGPWIAAGCEIAVADVNDKDALIRAFEGVEAAFVMLPPTFDPSPGFPEAQRAIRKPPGGTEYCQARASRGPIHDRRPRGETESSQPAPHAGSGDEDGSAAHRVRQARLVYGELQLGYRARPANGRRPKLSPAPRQALSYDCHAGYRPGRRRPYGAAMGGKAGHRN